MKLMLCPLNGKRNISEFIYGGELEVMPDPNQTSDNDWAKHIFYDHNKRGIVKEWWCHVATSYWFIVERNTLSDEILKTYDPSEKFNQKIKFNN